MANSFAKELVIDALSNCSLEKPSEILKWAQYYEEAYVMLSKIGKALQTAFKEK